MRIHIISQPHTQLTSEYIRCAYTQKVVKLCDMLVKEGMEVFVYASEDNDTKATLVTCITKKQLVKLGFNSAKDYLKNDFDITRPLWIKFQQNCIYELKKRVQKGDIIGTFSGRADKEIKEKFTECRFVELGIGYAGIFADFRVYESQAWMNTSYELNSNGRFYDTVIPNYFNPKDFPSSLGLIPKHYLYVGRMIKRKGLEVIDEMADRMPKAKFILAGQGAVQRDGVITCDDGTILKSKNLNYIGTIDGKRRGELMSTAIALICPTLYLPPFEGVHVEAMMCGTPIITSPFGVFSETYEQGVHGFRCNTINQFVKAAHEVYKLDREVIRNHAQSKYSMDVVAKQYMEYFELLDGLSRGGFYEK
jgi:glycosyltransferase involved in cell wall biosynthesis